jgi:hypothetical protein
MEQSTPIMKTTIITTIIGGITTPIMGQKTITGPLLSVLF